MDRPSESETVRLGLRLVLVASLLLFLLATLTEQQRLPVSTQPTPPPTDSVALDSLIIAGTRIGPVTLGLSTERVRQLLGPGQLRPQGEGVVHLYPEAGLVIYSEKGRVHSVTARSPIYRTRSGVGVGSDVNEVLQTLSGSYEMVGEGPHYRLHNWSEGWHLEVQNERVTYIQITTKLTETADN